MTEYIFKGYDFTELAACWNIEVKPATPNFAKNWDVDWTVLETIDVTHMINGNRVVFTIEDEEEVLAEKIKNYIREHLLNKNNQDVRDDINRFLEALSKESEDGSVPDSNYPVYRGLLSVECNFTFASWIVNNLETLWS